MPAFVLLRKNTAFCTVFLKDRDANDGITDIIVKAKDASMINRLYERFNLATVDMAAIKKDIEIN